MQLSLIFTCKCIFLQSLYREGKRLKEKVVDLRDAQEDLRQQMDSRKGKQRELKSQQDELNRGKCFTSNKTFQGNEQLRMYVGITMVKRTET